MATSHQQRGPNGTLPAAANGGSTERRRGQTESSMGLSSSTHNQLPVLSEEFNPRNPSASRASNMTINEGTRLLTVDRALQFSPFSSIIPFSPDIVPIPNSDLPGPKSLFTNRADRETTRRTIEFLNTEVAEGADTSIALRNAESDLKELLDPETITDFKFKQLPRVQNNRKSETAQTNGTPKSSPPAGIGAFASRILQQSNLAYRYPTPISPIEASPSKSPSISRRTPTKSSPKKKSNPKQSQRSPTSQQKAEARPTTGISKSAETYTSPPMPAYIDPSVLQKAPLTPATPMLVNNETSYRQNGTTSADTYNRTTPQTLVSVQVPISNIQKPTPPHPSTPSATIQPSPQTPQQARLQPAVVIPTPSADSRTKDYVTHDVPEAFDGSRKRKRYDEGSSLALTRDQRAEADEALWRLQEVIGDVLEADDEMQPDPSGVQSANYEQFFVAVFREDSAVNALCPAVHVRLDSALQKVIKLKRLEDISLDHLQRLQNLCIPTIASAENADILINEESSSDEVESWIQNLEVIGDGLRSARTVLRIMTGGREEKQLFSEELLLSIATTLKKALDCFVPVVEARGSGARTGLFESASGHRKAISQLLHDTNKVMILLVKLIGKEEVSESVINPLEYRAIGLLFVENAPNEKESVLGIQKFETLRRSAMDMITIIYSTYPPQRNFLFTELITSLQKLPTGRQAKRHYKLANGKSIQVVSALIMQLVQTIATSSPALKKSKKSSGAKSEDRVGDREILNDSDDEANESDESEESEDSTAETDEGREEKPHQSLAMEKLGKVADGLCNSAATSAKYAAVYLVTRAQTSSKTGDQPHRQLLDLFVEDLLTVLSAPDWPAAELLLRALFKSFSDIADNPKSPAPAKNMSLELLGMIGSSISEVVSNMQQAAKALDVQGSDLSRWLGQLVSDHSDGTLESREILALNGPFHAIVESLHPDSADDLQGTSARGYCLAQWAKAVSSGNLKGPENIKLAQQLRMALLHKGSLPFDSPDDITSNQSSVAYALVVLNMDLCRQGDYILRILLRSINTESTTVRSRALKSITQMLEGDPSILDRSRDFKLAIGQCTTDGSTMVRDNALILISKCISLRPALEVEFVPNILALANDSAAGVRKRTIKLLKEMYLRNQHAEMRIRIVDCLLQRVQDLDAGVLELARQTFEDIWLMPFWNAPEMPAATAQQKIAFREQMDLIVQTARRNENLRSVLEQLLIQVLSDGSKFANTNFGVCKSLVATAFEKILDATDERREQYETLLMLTVFAKAKPKLFTADQIQMLQPYIGNLSSTEDLDIFRSIVIIFRYTLPGLSDVHQELRRSVQTSLLGNIQKLYKTELNEVAQCLWKLNESLENPEKLVSLTKAVLKKIHPMKGTNFADEGQQDNMKRLRKCIWIVAAFGRHCNFEKHKDLFRRALPWWNAQENSTVADLVVQSMRPFADKAQPLSLRIEALEGIGNVCQAWPRQFTKKHISSAFEEILQKGEPELQHVVLQSFREFLHKIESQAASRSGETPLGADASKGAQLGASATASEDDGASTLIAQYFLKDLLKVALETQGDSAFTAAEIITSINRQGLAHPKNSLPTIVALETSTNASIADVALQGHKIMHQQHETALEPKYMQSVREAFRYQQDVVADPLGYNSHPVSAKLKGLWEVIRTSVGNYQKKFLSMYIKEIYVGVSNMDLSGSPPQTLQYARFLTENLAFFEYNRLDELLYTITSMEKVVSDNGSGLAHIITTEIFHVTVEIESETDKPAEIGPAIGGINGDGIPQSSGLTDPPPPSQDKTIDPARLYLLTANSVMLSMLWEARTYLRRLYGQNANNQRRENAKGKGGNKDLSKTPSRVQGVTSEKVISSIAKMVASLESQEGMMEQCERFVELLKIDNEVKVRDGSEEGSLDRPQTPDGEDDEDRDTPMSGSSRGHKRKGSASLSGTPGKRKRGRPQLKRTKSGRRSVDGDEGEDGEWM